MLGDVEAHTDRTAGGGDVASFVGRGFSVGGGKLEATLNQVQVRAYDGYKEHSLIVGLINNSTKTLNDYRVDLEIPAAFVNPSTTYNIEVAGRRTADYRFFRSEGKNHNIKVLRQGDRQPSFIKLDLVIPPMSTDSADLDKNIVVSVYAGDDLTQRIEKSVRDFLAQTPSFG